MFYKKTLKFLFSLFLTLSILINPALAKEYQPTSSIKKEITQYILDNIDTKQDFEITVNSLDDRLKLPKCTIPLETYSRYSTLKAGTLSIGIRCRGKQPWSLYNSAKLKIYKSVLVLKENIGRNTLIYPELVTFQRTDITKLSRGYFTNFSQLQGATSIRNIQAGRVLRPAQFISQKLIKKGDKVTIRAKSKSFTIQMSGHALSDGKLGEQIRVKNSRTKKVVEGTVIEIGVISVN